MSDLEAIKKSQRERIWLEPEEDSDPYTGQMWCEDNQWGDKGVEYVLASTLESLQRENEALKEENGSLIDENSDLRNEPWPEWANAVVKVVRSHSGYDGYDDATEGVDMPLELEEHLSEMDAENERLRIRAEAAEAEVARLQAEIDRKSSMPGDHRYWEGRYRDEAAENDRLRGILFKCGSFIADRYQEGDAEYQVVLLVNDAICSKPALASTGGEHNAE